jgi:hypothetical protein
MNTCYLALDLDLIFQMFVVSFLVLLCALTMLERILKFLVRPGMSSLLKFNIIIILCMFCSIVTVIIFYQTDFQKIIVLDAESVLF